MNRKTSITLVIPCYNEEKNIQALHKVIEQTFKNSHYVYDLIFIDDGSNDGTLKILKSIWKTHENISVLSFSKNFGKEAAIYAGLKKSTGDLVTIIDADLQQRPQIIMDMLEVLEKNTEYDCVAAFQENRIEGKAITFLKNLFYKVINKISDTKFYSGASDFRTMRRNMIDAVVSLEEYYRFSKGIFSWVGFNTYYMPYQVDPRNSGESKWSIINLFKYALEGIVAFTTFPLKIATYLGAITALVSILYMIVIIIQKVFFSIDVPGYPTIISLILFIGGIQLFIQGIIGEYLARVYIQGKSRPIYIVREAFDSGESVLNDLREILVQEKV